MLRILSLLWLLLAALVGPMTGRTFFEKNPQRRSQWGRVRRGGGYTAAQFTLHTFEAPLGDRVLTWATWLLRRTDPGSYHWLFDAHRKFLRLAPWSAETWHSVPTNNWAVGASAVMRATDWRRLNAAKPGSTLHTYRQNLIYGFALAAADFSRWLISQGRDPVPKRILTRAQAMRKEAGFIFHRDTDPARRTDPANPRDEFPWTEFFAEYDRLMAGGTTPSGPSARPDVEIQLALAVLGMYDAGPNLQYLDGKNGDHQKAAVSSYQKSRRLHVDGWWGTNTNKHFEEHDMSKIVDQIASAVKREVPSISQIRQGQSLHTGKMHEAVIRELAPLNAKVDGLSEAVSQLATGQGLDPEAITAAIEAGVNDALDRVRVVVAENTENEEG